MSDTKNNTVNARTTALMHFMQSTTALSARIVYCGLGALTLTAAATDNANAIPKGGSVAAGSASISYNGATPGTSTNVTITQTTNKAVIDWTGFNTAKGESVTFLQPSTKAIALNRISGGATSFKGALNANGNVWLINPDGFLFNSNSVIRVGGLLLSTAGISQATGAGFYTNTTKDYSFDQPGNPNASIQLDGTIVDAISGNIIIQAPAVAITNGSILSASNGNIGIGAGQTFDFDDGLVHFQYNVDSSDPQAVTGLPQDGSGNNSYAIYIGSGTGAGSKNQTQLNATNGATSPSGKIIIAADVDPNVVYDNVINLGGLNATYKKNNPEGLIITPKPQIKITTSPAPTTAPSPTPSPTTAPSPTPSPTTAPSPTPSPTTAPSPTPSPTTAPSPTPSPTTAPSPTPSPTTAPSPTPSPTTAPSPTPAPAPAPVTSNLPLRQQDLFTAPLTRQFTSLGSETVLDTTVNPLVANVSYERPYTVSLPVSFADGKLSLFAQNTTNLGNIAPAAGGNNPADLSPSAGGTSNSIACANAYLDMQWAVSPAQRPCDK